MCFTFILLLVQSKPTNITITCPLEILDVYIGFINLILSRKVIK